MENKLGLGSYVPTEMQTLAKELKKVGYVGSLALKKGMKLFAINTETHELNTAVYRANLQTGRKELHKQKDCVYIIAINEKNALRKYLKALQKVLQNK